MVDTNQNFSKVKKTNFQTSVSPLESGPKKNAFFPKNAFLTFFLTCHIDNFFQNVENVQNTQKVTVQKHLGGTQGLAAPPYFQGSKK